MKTKPIFIFCIIFLLSFTLGCEEKEDEYQYGHYENEFKRHYFETNEREAICTCENINYTSFFNISRYSDKWPNFIDRDVIENYNTSFYTDKDEEREANIYYSYQAWGKYYSQMNVELRRNRSDLLIEVNGEYPISNTERYPAMYFDNVIVGTIENGNWTIIKNNEYFILDEAEDFRFELELIGGYYVEMDLDYVDVWASLAGVFAHTRQIIILDEFFQPILILLSPSSHIVS